MNLFDNKLIVACDLNDKRKKMKKEKSIILCIYSTFPHFQPNSQGNAC